MASISTLLAAIAVIAKEVKQLDRTGRLVAAQAASDLIPSPPSGVATKPILSPGKPEVIGRPGGGEPGRRGQLSLKELVEEGASERLVEQATPAKSRTWAINELTGEVEHLGKGRPRMEARSDSPNIPFKEGDDYVPSKFELEGSMRPRRPGDPKLKDFVGPRTREQMAGLVTDVKGLEKTMEELRPQVAKGNIDKSELEEAARATMKLRATKRAARVKEESRKKTPEARANRLAALKRGEQKYMPRGTKPSEDPGPTEIFGEDIPLSEADFRAQGIATPGRALALPKGKEPPRARRAEELPGGTAEITEDVIEEARKYKVPEGETGLIDPEPPVNFDRDVYFGGGRVLRRTLAETKAFEKKAKKIRDDRKFIRQSKAKEDRASEAEEAIRYKKRLGQEREALEAFQEGAEEGARGRPSLVHRHRPYTGEEFSVTRHQEAADQLLDLGATGRKGFVEDIQDILDRYGITDIFEFDVREKGKVVFNKIIRDMIGDRDLSNKISKIWPEIRAIEKVLKRDVPPGKMYDAQRQQLQVARRDLAAVIQKLANGSRVARSASADPLGANGIAAREAGTAEIVEALKRFRTIDVKVGKQMLDIPSERTTTPEARIDLDEFFSPRLRAGKRRE